MKTLTLGSLFDGIGGWQLAAVRAGIVPIWSSEIEAFPIEVTKRHFPRTLQFGDVTKLNGARIPPVDIICAGSPCQDLSVAGKRAGLAGERSGLFVQAINIVRQMRRATGGQKPRFFVWENVPGAFSSNQRQDFRAVLEEIGQAEIPMPRSGRWADAGMVRTEAADICWRVLDAQYWGVPQRRKRIFLVADFATSERCAAKVLFEPASVPRDSTASKGTEDRAPGRSQDSIVHTSQNYSEWRRNEKLTTLRAAGGNYGGGEREPRETVGTLAARDFKGVGNQYVQEGKLVVQDD